MATPVSSTVLKAFDIIELFTRRPLLNVPLCADELAIPRSTAYRLLATLREAGVVETTTNGNFRLGLRLLQIGSAAPLRVELVERARQPLEQLADEANLTAELAVRSGAHLLHLERVRGSLPAPVDPPSEEALHATAVGKVLLAATDPDSVAALIGPEPARHTPATIVERAELLVELEQVAARGWADDRGESAAGFWGLAVPLHDRPAGDVVAAVGVVGPAAVVHRHHLRLRRVLAAAVRRMERRDLASRNGRPQVAQLLPGSAG